MDNSRSRKQSNETQPPTHARRIWTQGEFWNNVNAGQHYAVKSSRAGIKYFHHFLISEVFDYRKLVKVIHYTGTATEFLLTKCFGSVVEVCMEPGNDVCNELLDVNKGLYVIDDPSYRTYGSPHEVIARARKRLGECSYDALRNNCEHFVRWALTGHPRSVQVDNASPVFRAIGEWTNELKAFGPRMMMKLAKDGLHNAVMGLVKLVRDGSSRLVQGVASACSSFGLSLFLEVPFLLWNGTKNKKLMDEGKISKKDFESCICKDVFVSGVSLAASAIGYFVGSLLCPFAGHILGGICGFLGRFVGPLLYQYF